MRQSRLQSGFSLLEVVIAVAVAGGSLVAVLALLSQLGKQAARSADGHTALQLPAAVRAELDTLVATRGFDAVAASAPVRSPAADNALLLVAGRDGQQVRPLVPGESPARDQFFLIEIRRFPDAHLAHDPAASVLALGVRVSWPYRGLTPAGMTAVAPVAQRQTAEFNTAIRR